MSSSDRVDGQSSESVSVPHIEPIPAPGAPTLGSGDSEPPAGPSENWSSDFQGILEEIRERTLLVSLAGLVLAGFFVLVGWNAIREPVNVAAIAVVGVTAGVVWLLRRSTDPAGLLVVVGSAVVLVLLVTVGGVTAALPLLGLPVGLATMLFGGPVGALAGIVSTLFLWLTPDGLLQASALARIVAVLTIWGMVAMLWFTLHPLIVAVEWAWSGYEQAQLALNQARDTQVYLKQTLEDLADANLQLTRLNQLADGLRQLAEEARYTKERFVANVSHELRTPLNMIIGFSEMIMETPGAYGRVSPKLLADLAVIHRNAQHLSELISDVLDLSQIETGRMAITKERVQPGDIIEAAILAVRPLFQSKGLYLKVNVSADLPTVLCDRTRVREVLLNLLSNAGRFTDTGGVEVQARQDGHSLIFRVSDTGPGITEADQKRLFEPFQQADDSIRRRFGGSGLGLSISKSFVELHGGRMWLESTVGRGTTFFFTLPVEEPVASEPQPTRWLRSDWPLRQRTRRSLAPRAAPRPRLIIAESGHTLWRLLTRYMDGVDLIAVASLEEASRELAAVPAQALLVNDSAAGDPLQRVRDSTLPKETAVILCSVPETTQTAAMLGAVNYLVKPVQSEELLGAVDRAISEARRQGQDAASVPASPGKAVTVLIVDDEPDAQQLFMRTLRSARPKYRVLTAGNGREGLALLQEQKVDAIILDLVMPEMTGWQFLATKNADPVLRHIPAIIVSARDPLDGTIVSSALIATRGNGLSHRENFWLE